jgi:DNA-binding GntR family transcriptional regulator
MRLLNEPAPNPNVVDRDSPVPVREQTVHALREAILTFELKPGQRLVEREFIARLGISRTTFRDALRQLSYEGLVTVVARKGARVSSPSNNEAADLYEIRASLEAIAVRRFIERASEDEFLELKKKFDEFAAVVESTTDIFALLESNAHFYRVLIRGAKSDMLDQLLSTVRSRTHEFRSRSLSVPGRAAQSASGLRLMLDAIVDRNADLAAMMCIEHVRLAGRIAAGVPRTAP